MLSLRCMIPELNHFAVDEMTTRILAIVSMINIPGYFTKRRSVTHTRGGQNRALITPETCSLLHAVLHAIACNGLIPEFKPALGPSPARTDIKAKVLLIKSAESSVGFNCRYRLVNAFPKFIISFAQPQPGTFAKQIIVDNFLAV